MTKDGRARAIEWMNLTVLGLTLTAVVWYTIETTRLRRATERQITLSYAPNVILVIKDRIEFQGNSYSGVVAYLRNVGSGPAFNVSLTPLENVHASTDGPGSNEAVASVHDIPGLAKDTEIPVDVFVGGFGTMPSTPEEFAKFLRSHGPGGGRMSRNNFPVTITFADMNGIQHTTKQDIRVDYATGEVKPVMIFSSDKITER